MANGESFFKRFFKWWRGDGQRLSIGYALDQYKGNGPGFDFLRLGLALLIFYVHTNYALTPALGVFVADAAPSSAQTEYTLEMLLVSMKSRVYVLLVPMFFALSGFLVTASALRLKSVTTFLIFRGLRIFPALSVEVTLSALFLGVFFTTVPLADYFISSQFFRYFGNIIGFVTFHLPGVFLSNPQSGIVNINLWTLPAEFYCYLILSAVMIAGFLKPSRLVLAAIVLSYCVAVVMTLGFGIWVEPHAYATPIIVCHFLLGSAFYLWRHAIPLNLPLFCLCSVMVLVTMLSPLSAAIAGPFVVYITVYLGMMKWLSLKFMRGLDYSYGIYLYGFPVTQAVVAANPDISRMMLLFIALPITIAIAVLSWHYIEKPFLRFKRPAKVPEKKPIDATAT